MYLEFYGLDQAPFSITPDPHYVFLSEHHRDALAHLLYGIQQGGSGGFVQLTGEVGTGKTTLSRLLLNQLPENTQAALVLNPRLDPVELLQTICDELRLKVPARSAAVGAATDNADGHAPRGGKAYYDALSAYLLDAYARGQRVVLIIDEAQNLSPEALEQVRLLTNLETETQKLLQIILIGQPELRDMLARPELRQLAQRITARYHLPPLADHGTAAYLRHRLTTAGARRFPFSADAVRRIHRHSGGVPRLINVIAERALLGGYAQDLLTIDAATVDRAAKEALAPTAHADEPATPRRALIALGALVAIALLVTAILSRRATQAPADTATTDDAAATSVVPHPAQSTPHAASAPAAISPAMASSMPATVPATMPTTTAPPVPSLLDGAALMQAVQHSSTASLHEWQALNLRWKSPPAARATSPDACLPMPAPGWHCLRSRATLDQLAHFDRAVLLRLRAEPVAVWASLRAIDARRVRLSIDGRTLDIDRAGLGSVWNGEYLALWPAPDALGTRFAAGEAQARAWVRERLREDGSGEADPAIALHGFRARHGLADSAGLDADTQFVLATRQHGPRLDAATE